MWFECKHCQKGMEFSGEHPSFCPYCGKAFDFIQSTVTFENRAIPLSKGSSLDQTQAPPPQRESLFVEKKPDAVGDYEILQRLGSGGMGTVYEAKDKFSDKHVAIKIIKPSVASSKLNLERFQQEGRLASLIAHPRCVFVYKADTENNMPYIVMELMPGATIRDLVSAQGPLGIGQSVRKILDVIDGLLAAHDLGVMHRDVKPSNCFVMLDGRVKVGDFGLSKLLRDEKDDEADPHDSTKSHEQQDGYLTRTGTFVGTPLYASPEQIKGEPVDFRSDIYSVSATLFFMLTGQAPFEGGDATATVARIVTEDPPSVKQYRPEVPTELDKVISKGLATDRESRYSTLQEMRAALVPFLPGQVRMANRMIRIRAGIVDVILLSPLLLLLGQIVPRCSGDNFTELEKCLTSESVQWLVVYLYYYLTEFWFAASMGKKLLGLRVCGLKPGKPVGRSGIFKRTLITVAIIALPGLFALAISQSFWVQWGLHLAGLLVLVDSIRARLGNRGFHDRLTGTCVEQLPWITETVKFPTLGNTSQQNLDPDFPREVGNFVLEGIRGWRGETLYVIGKDRSLDRPAWVMISPGDQAPITSRRREISRSTRLRWLGSGVLTIEEATARKILPRNPQSTWTWDAFLAPVTGASLVELIESKGPLNWAEASAILEQLCEELHISASDGTIPEQLTPGQVWLQADGQLLLIGTTFHDEAGKEFKDKGTPKERALKFLRETSQIMLEGSNGKPKKPGNRLHAPVPLHVRPAFEKLFDDKAGYNSPGELLSELQTNKNRPKSVSVPLRLGHLLLMSLLIGPFVMAMFIIARYFNELEPTLNHTIQVRQIERSERWLNAAGNELGLYSTWLKEENFSKICTDKEKSAFQMAAIFMSPMQRDQMLSTYFRGILQKQQFADTQKLRSLEQRLSQVALVPYTLVVDWLSSADFDLDTAHSKDTNPLFWRVLRRVRSNNPEIATSLAFINRLSPKQWAFLAIVFWPIIWTVWAFVFRGGLTYRLMGIDLLSSNGKPASRWQCAWRTMLVWLPIVGLLLWSVQLQSLGMSNVLSWGVWWLAVIMIVAAACWTLVRPRRSFHDKLSGIHLLPR